MLDLSDLWKYGGGQEQPPAAEPNYEFVSGTITELPPGRIVVNRALLGRPPENRTFLMNAETKVEGKLKPRPGLLLALKPPMKVMLQSGSSCALHKIRKNPEF